MPLKVNLAHHPFDALCVVFDLGHVFPHDPPGYVLRGGWAAAAQALHEHQGLADVAHAHAFGDVVAQALVGGGGGRGYEGILALWGPVLGRDVTGGGTGGGEATTAMPAPKPAHGRDLLTPLGWGSQETAMTDQLGRITINPEICHGKPTIRGLRYPVEMVLELLSAGMSAADILADYPDLEAEDITAVLEYATQLSRIQRVDLLSA